MWGKTLTFLKKRPYDLWSRAAHVNEEALNKQLTNKNTGIDPNNPKWSPTLSKDDTKSDQKSNSNDDTSHDHQIVRLASIWGDLSEQSKLSKPLDNM